MPSIRSIREPIRRLARCGHGRLGRAALVVLTGAVATAAAAQDQIADPLIAYTASALRKPREIYPQLSGEARFEFENGFRYHAQGANKDTKRNLLFTTFEPELTLAFNEHLSVLTELQLEPVRDPTNGDNQTFEDEGIFTEQLYAEWKGGRFSVRAGKFEPIFGRSFEESRELFGDEYSFEYEEFSEDTEITERLGASADVELGSDSAGSHKLTFDLFDTDTSNLSRSAIRSRGRTRRSDGGPSNSGRLKSFGLNLIGEEIPQLPGFGYHLGFVYQDSGQLPLEDADDALAGTLSPVSALPSAPAPRADRMPFFDPTTGRPQRSYVAGFKYDIDPSEDVQLKLFSEYLYLDNADGARDRIRNLLTVAGSAILRKDLYLGFSYARRNTRLPQAPDLKDYLLQTSATYYRDLGADRKYGRLGFEVALRPSRDGGNRSGTTGLRLIWVKEF